MLCRKCHAENKNAPMPKDYDKMFKKLIFFRCEKCGEGNPVNIKTEDLKKHREVEG